VMAIAPFEIVRFDAPLHSQAWHRHRAAKWEENEEK